MSRPLIIRLRNWVGDVVLGLPTLQRLERSGYRLVLVGKAWASDLLAGHGWPVHVLGTSAVERVRQLKQLRDDARAGDAGFDQRINAIAFPYSLSSALEMRLAGLRAIGHRHEGRGWLLSHPVRRLGRDHELANYWHLANALLGEESPPPGDTRLAIAPTDAQAAAELRNRLGLRPGYVVVCPFAGGTFEKLDKCWPQFPRFVDEALPSLGRDVLICPGPGAEVAQARRDFAACTLASGVRLGTYAALLRDAALVVSNDTGPGHMAAAVGSPLLSVLGPTDPSRWGAVGPSVHIVQRAPGWPSVDEVLARAQTLLNAG